MDAYSRILVVFEGPGQSAATAILDAAGFRAITTCAPAGAACALGDPREFAVAVVESPAEQALALVTSLRRDRRFERLPLILAPEGAMAIDVYEAFDAGATDVLVPPIAAQEFVVRVRAHIRRAGRLRGLRRIDCGGKVLDFDSHHVVADQRRETLTPRETAILEHLALRPGRPATTEELLVEALGYPPSRGNPEVVRTHVRHLRQKLEPDPARPRFLVNVPRVGYLLAVEEAAAPSPDLEPGADLGTPTG